MYSNPVFRWMSFCTTLVLLCLAAVGVNAAAVVRGPYLQNATTNGIEVRWRTDEPMTSTVRFGTAVDQQLEVVSGAALTTEHGVNLTALVPDTKYYYSIYSGETLLAGGAGYWFVTSPMFSRPTRIWAIGDAGTASLGSSAPRMVHDAYEQFTGLRRTDVWLMLGDNAYYSGTDSEYQASVFDVFPELLRTTPVWSTLGNHETYAPDGLGNIAYTSIFSLPQDGRAGGIASGTERYYSFDYGNIHFVCLDSELSDKSPGGPMLAWLEADLAASDKEWTIAFWHSPPYSKGSHDSDFESNLVLMRQNALPILEAHGVDLVLCGHSHSYERSRLLHGHYGSSVSLTSGMVVDAGSGRTEGEGAYAKSPGGSQAGTVYAVAGSSGQTSGGMLNHPAMYVSLNRLGSLVIDVENRRMDVKFLRETGEVDDHFTILKGDVPARIVTGPVSQTKVVGATARFEVVASGTPPFLYQWWFGGTRIEGATASVLTMENVQSSSAGLYTVTVSNQFGGEMSAAARLTVIEPSTNCLSDSLVAWWPLEGSGSEFVAGNSLLLNGGPVYLPGKVELGWKLDGVDDYGRVPASPRLDVGGGDGLTLEMWIKPDSIGSAMAMAEWSGSGGALGAHFFVTTLSVGDLYANLIDRAGAPHPLASSGGKVVVNEFQHVALTYDKATGLGRLYRNGEKVAEANLGSFEVETRLDLTFGRRVLGGPAYAFRGMMDEIALHDRALSPEQVSAIYVSDAIGRCQRPPPTNHTYEVVAGAFTWAEAKADAERRGGYLATITSQEEYDHILGLGILPSTDYWLGATDQAVEGVWTWVTGEPWSFAKWKAGEPNNLGEEDYLIGSLSIGHQWNDVGRPTTTVGHYLMETGGFLPPPPPPPPPTNHAYQVVSGTFTWHQAKTDAERRGGHLATITSQAEYDFILGLGILPATDYWLGGTDEAVEGVWTWVTGEPWSFAKWRSGEPNNLSDEDYLIGSQSISHQWNDVGRPTTTVGNYLLEYDVLTPPVITRQPQGQEVYVGGTVTFSVEAVGPGRLEYQWLLGTEVLPGRTNSQLVLAGAQPGQAGVYTVRVASPYGQVVSSNALLVVNPLPPQSTNCIPTSPSLVGWWPFDQSPDDLMSGNNAVLSGNPSYAPGKAVDGLNFDGSDDYGRVPASGALDVGVGAGLTVELWINPAAVGSSMTLVEWSDTVSRLGLHFTLSTGGGGNLYANLIGRNGQSHSFSSPVNQVVAGVFQHVALTYDRGSGVARMYRDGSKVAEANLGVFDVETRPDMYLGTRVLGGTPYRFVGVMDEVAIHSRALTEQEVASIHAAGAAGRCREQKPLIVTQPVSVTAVLGQSAGFSVSAIGSKPLFYQWYSGETVLGGETNKSLSLSNLTFAQTGSYWVAVTNSFGAATSQVATLTVQYPAARVQVVNAETLAAGPVQVPIELVANGNENAVSFSLGFNPARLALSSVALGSGAAGGTLDVDSQFASSGLVGVRVALGAGQTFGAGTQRVATVTFAAAPSGSVLRLPISFGDEPVARQLADAAAGVLPAEYVNGTVTVNPTTVQAGSVEAVTGGAVSVPLQLLAVGQENAVSFSLSFSNAILSFVGAQPGADLPPDASILINTNLAGTGNVGVSVALPAGATFGRGARELVRANFEVATVLNPLTTPIRFGDSPTIRQVANQSAQAIPAVFKEGAVSVVAVAFEADIAPRPGGDQILSLIDWVQAGRFASALDPVDPAEFQRVDCAPRSTRGNGVISVADWVQAGRYSAGLDPITGIGGPTEPAVLAPASAGNGGATCTVRIPNTNVLPGATLQVPVVVSASGLENALGFSLTFDSTKLQFVAASKLGPITSATLNLNLNQAASGKVGVAFALPVGTTLNAGSQNVLLLSFTAAPAVSGTTTLAFADVPVLREAVSVTANTLPSSFASADIVLGTAPVFGPPVNITRSSSGVVLYWPSSATGFELYASEAPQGRPWSKVTVAPIEIAGQKIVTLPTTGEQQYFRLRKP